MTFTLRPFHAGDRAACAEVLAVLPDWFGLPAVNEATIAALRPDTTLVVHDGDQRIVAFLGLEEHDAASWEIAVMGVVPDLHRMGIGRRLVAAAIDQARAAGVRWLHVKTRGPSTYDENYERTRRFYRGLGFEPLYESRTEWGPDDAALVLVMRLD